MSLCPGAAGSTFSEQGVTFDRRGRVRLGTEMLVRRVKAESWARYDEGGWDVIAEAWSDEDIAAALGRATTVAGALRKIRPIVETYADRQADAANSAF